MEDFFATHNDPSAGFFGESLVDATQGIGEGFESVAMSTSAAPPIGRRLGESSESAAMSASGAPPIRRRKVTVTRNKQANFTAYEDKVLCKAWLEISCDAVTNTGQRKEAFWARVHSRYNSKRGTYPERTSKSLIGHWDSIKAEVSKFGGYVADKIRSNPSGMTDADKSVAAAADFADIEKHNFTLMHCWQILKDEPKWHELKEKLTLLRIVAPGKMSSRLSSATFWILIPMILHQLPLQANVPWGGMQQKQLRRRKQLQLRPSTRPRCMTSLLRSLRC